MRAIGHVHGVVMKAQLVPQFGHIHQVLLQGQLPALHGHGVVHLHPRTGAQQTADHGAAGGLAHVVGFGFEGQSPDAKTHAAQIVAKVGQHLVQNAVFLALIDVLHRAQNLHGNALFNAGAVQCFHIFGKARATVARARIQKAVANAGVRAHALAHRLNVHVQAFAQIGQLVHERDAGGQHGVGGVFGQFSRALGHHQGAFVVAVEGRVEVAHLAQRPLARFIAGHAEHDAVRAHEVFDRRTFF